MFKKQISQHSSKQIFWNQFCLWKTPPSRFCCFPLFTCLDFEKLFHFPNFGELKKLHAKNFMFFVKIGREIIFQSWLLFDWFYTQCYNFPIVQWSDKNSCHWLNVFECIYPQNCQCHKHLLNRRLAKDIPNRQVAST